MNCQCFIKVLLKYHESVDKKLIVSLLIVIKLQLEITPDSSMSAFTWVPNIYFKTFNSSFHINYISYYNKKSLTGNRFIAH